MIAPIHVSDEHTPQPIPPVDDDDDDDDKSKPGSGGNIDPDDDDEGGSEDDEDEDVEDETLWTGVEARRMKYPEMSDRSVL